MARRGTRIERSAGGVVLRRIDGEVHVLLIKDPYRNWGLPKGHVEPGEEDLGAALREVKEETGLAELRAGPALRTIDWTFRLRGRRIHKFCAFYLMVSPRGTPVPERREGITDCRWFALSRAVDAIAYDNAREVLREAVALMETSPHPLPIDV